MYVNGSTAPHWHIHMTFYETYQCFPYKGFLGSIWIHFPQLKSIFYFKSLSKWHAAVCHFPVRADYHPSLSSRNSESIQQVTATEEAFPPGPGNFNYNLWVFLHCKSSHSPVFPEIQITNNSLCIGNLRRSTCIRTPMCSIHGWKAIRSTIGSSLMHISG